MNLGTNQNTLNNSERDRTNALYQAAFQGNEDTVRSILDAWPQLIDEQTDNQENALMGAIEGGHDSIVQFLLEQGADCTQSNQYDNTMLHRAAEQGNEKIVELLLKASPQTINAQTVDGDTPLMNAAQEGHIPVVRLLLEHGADPHIKDTMGYNVLHVAASEGQDETIEFLLKQTPQLINTQTEHKYTPLMIAARQDHFSIIKLFLEHGAQSDLRESVNGNTALHLSARESATLYRNLQHTVHVDKRKKIINDYRRQKKSIQILLAFSNSMTIKNRHGQSLFELLEGPLKEEITTFYTELKRAEETLKRDSRELYERGAKGETDALRLISTWLYLSDKPIPRKLIAGHFHLFKEAKNDDVLKREKARHTHSDPSARVLFEGEPTLTLPKELYDRVTAYALEPYGIPEKDSNLLRYFFSSQNHHLKPDENELVQRSHQFTLR